MITTGHPGLSVTDPEAQRPGAAGAGQADNGLAAHQGQRRGRADLGVSRSAHPYLRDRMIGGPPSQGLGGAVQHGAPAVGVGVGSGDDAGDGAGEEEPALLDPVPFAATPMTAKTAKNAITADRMGWRRGQGCLPEGAVGRGGSG